MPVNAFSHLEAAHIELPKTREIEDIRLGHLTDNNISEATLFAIIGFPTDEGVQRNGGRTGAAQAPNELRKQLYKFTPTAFHERFRQKELIADLGNIKPAALETMQQQLGETIAFLLSKNIRPIVLGGGHETAFGHALGYLQNATPFQCINVDAHLDVRPLVEGKAHSGSPFRQATEYPHSSLTRYDVLGAQYHSMSEHHRDWVHAHGGRVMMRNELNHSTLQRLRQYWQQTTYLSIDIDAFDASIAPGVSAPAVHGLSTSDWIMLLDYLPISSITSVDLVEYNPSFDIDGRTAKLSAWLLYTLMAKWCQ